MVVWDRRISRKSGRVIQAHRRSCTKGRRMSEVSYLQIFHQMVYGQTIYNDCTWRIFFGVQEEDKTIFWMIVGSAQLLFPDHLADLLT